MTKYRYVLTRKDGSRDRDHRVYEGDPPEEAWQLEITIGRDRVRARVTSVHWPDRKGHLPAEVLVQEL